MKKKIAVLLINLGTPDNCDEKSVYRYLSEFLNDPRVVDLPMVFRWLLVNLVIIPFRYKKSAHAYEQIWTKKGSPLRVYSEKLKTALAVELGEEYQVEMAMRYGKPSIREALNKPNGIANAIKIIALPLFPQYASAATGSAIAKLLNELAREWNIPQITIIRDFYADTGFVDAYAHKITEVIEKANQKPDTLLFSYHGLPERHIHKSGCEVTCDLIKPCPGITDQNANCYRAQCYTTSRLIGEKIGLPYEVAFQSRLGRTPWIKPYTDLILNDLLKKGIKKIAVACPSFVADCLETLEEVHIRLRNQWLSSGGEDFIAIPCLNDDTGWVKAMAALLKRYAVS